MALGSTLDTFFGDEWARFIAGLERLNPQDYRNIRDAFARQQLPEKYKNIVSVPGWEDLIRWPHGPVLSGNDFRQYYLDQRQGRGCTQGAEMCTAIERAIDQRNRMLGAPDAQMAGSFGQVFNAIDNVQDLAVTVGLLGHLTLWAAPRVFGRFIPVVGSILLVSDLLNVLNLLGQLASPLYAMLCNGPIAGLAAGVPALLMGPGLKGHSWRTALMSPWSRLGMLKGLLPKFGIGSAIGLLIQGPQVTTSLWGYGIALGGLVGILTQGATGLALNLSGDTVHWPGGLTTGSGAVTVLPPSGSWLPAFHRGADALSQLVNRPLAEDNPGDLVRLHQCATIMACAPSVLSRPEFFTPEQYTETLAMHVVAQKTVYARLEGYPWQDLILDENEERASPYAVLSSGSAVLLEEQGLQSGTAVPFDLPGHPYTVRSGDLVADQAPRLKAGIERFCGQQRNTHFGSFAGDLVNAGVDHAWEHLAGTEKPVRWELAPDWKALSSLAENNRIPMTGRDDQRLWAFWQAARAEMAGGRAKTMTPARWDALAAAHGVTLMKLLPPDAVWPAEWETWLDERRHVPGPRA